MAGAEWARGEGGDGAERHRSSSCGIWGMWFSALNGMSLGDSSELEEDVT